MYLQKLIPVSFLIFVGSIFAENHKDLIEAKKIETHRSSYVIGASLGYSYFSKKDLDIYYAREADNNPDEISINKRYKNPSLGLLFGINNSIDNPYISSVFYGLKAVYFEGTSKGEMVPLKDRDFKCSDTNANLSLKSLIILLNSRLFFNYQKAGLSPFIDLGIGANLYDLGLKVTGDVDQFDTKLERNKKIAFAYNLGLGITKDLGYNWHGNISYNFYGSQDLRTRKTASYGLNLAKAVKPEFQNNNISLEVQKYFNI